jgi:hypothetical protein
LKAGSGHLPHGGHGGTFLHFLHDTTGGGQAGHTGGTISDFKIYWSSSPDGISERDIPLF